MNKAKNRQQITDVRNSKGWKRLVRILSCLVVFCTTYAMILPAITASATTYCDHNEHSHEPECYEQQLICSLSEHEHGEDCYDAEENLICSQQEHDHDSDCFRDILTCEKEEHIHTTICFSNPQADLETEKDWQNSLPEPMEGSLAEQIVAVARSQENVEESTENYEVDETSTGEVKIRGITRYGQWDNDPYEDNWSASFARFVLDACQIEAQSSKDPQQWIKILEEKDELKPADQGVSGNILFVTDPDDEENLKTGIVLDIDENEKTLTAMMADWQKKVQPVTFRMDDINLYSIYSVETDRQIESREETSSDIQSETEEIFSSQEKTENTPEESQTTKKSRQKVAASLSNEQESIQFSNAKVQYKESDYGDSTEWLDMDENTELKENFILRFSFDYRIPAGSLKKGESYDFHLPQEIKEVRAVNNQPITTDNGQIVGTYSIEPDGSVHMYFNDDYVLQHANAEVTGKFEFITEAKNVKQEGQNESEIKFSDEVLVLRFLDTTPAKGDVTVVKDVRTVDFDQVPNKVQYAIRVSTQSGTFEEVYLEDIMENLNPETIKEFRIVRHGQEEEQVIQKTDTNSGFTLTLPKMEAGEYYELTYWVDESNPESKEDYKGINTVHVTTKDEKEKEITGSYTTYTDFKHHVELLKKTSQRIENGKVRWTITVNQSRQDISGWTLSDVLNGEEFKTESISIDPPIVENGESKRTVSLPYTFPEGTKETYTLVYETPEEVAIGQGHMINKATLYSDDSQTVEESTADQWVDIYEPLTKECLSPNLSGEDRNEKNEIHAEWKIAVHADKGKIPAGTIIKDSTDYQNWNGGSHHYFTRDQILDMSKNLNQALKEAGLQENCFELKARLVTDSEEVWKTQEEISQADEEVRYWSIEIELKQDIPSGTEFSFTYQTTSDVSDQEEKTYGNSASLTGQQDKWVSFTYKGPKPEKLSVTKTAKSEGENYQDLIQEKGILWQIQVDKPASFQDEAIKVVEYLPASTILKYLELTDSTSGNTQAVLYDNQSITDDLHGLSLKKVHDQWWEIEIPKSMLVENQKQTFLFTIGLEVLDSYQWGNRLATGGYEGRFSNRVNLCVDNTIIEDKYSDQIIKNMSSDSTVTKTAQIPDDKLNVVDYELDINPEGKDLVEGSDELILEDDLLFTKKEERDESWWYKEYYNAELDVNSFTIYQIDSEGRQTILSPELYTFSFERYRDTGNTDSYHSRIKATIPDGMHLKICYSYQLERHKNYAGDEEIKASLNNAVSLYGNSKLISENGNFTETAVQKSSVTANTAGLKIIKVDSRNSKQTLSHARFKLYRYDPDAQDALGSWKGFVDTGYVLETDENGEIVFGLAQAARNGQQNTIQYNTAYMLEEIEAPSGYQLPEQIDDRLIEFYVPGKGDSKTYPENFKGIYTEGSRIYFSNEKTDTHITIHKIWMDQNGADISSKRDNPIKFELWRKTENGEEEKIDTFTVGPTDDPQTSWIKTINNLARTDENGNTCYYSVKEVGSGENYEVSYSNNEISEGVITVTNTLTSDFRLPETGSMAENVCQILGTGMLSAGMILYTRKKLKEKRK